MQYCSIASGSSGNCIYVGHNNTHLLVDVGISGKRVKAGLDEIGIAPEELSAIFITHEHIDHIGGLGVISRKYHIPVFCTSKTRRAILSTKSVGKMDESLFREVCPDEDITLEDICISPSATWHDAVDPVCYSFLAEGSKVSVVTDLGDFDEYLIHKLKDSDGLYIEANHDVRMLEAGAYPYSLKMRILGKRGHLSNERSGELILRLLNPRLKEITLGHLSKENNYPELAYEAVRSTLLMNQVDLSQVHLQVANRDQCSPMVAL